LAICFRHTMAATSTAVLATLRQHIPLIKFRKGQLPEAFRPAEVAGGRPVMAAPATAGQTTGPIAAASAFGELPARFRRRAIDDLECAAINAGGRDKPFQ